MMQRSGLRLMSMIWPIMLGINAVEDQCVDDQCVQRSPKRPSHAKALHVTLLQMPDFVEGSEEHKKIDDVFKQVTDTIPGVRGTFNRYGNTKFTKDAFLEHYQVMNLSLDMTHCIHLIADDLPSLKKAGDAIQEKFLPIAQNFIKWSIAVDTELGVKLELKDETDPLMMFALYRFKPHVTADSEVYASMQKAASAFNTLPGISAAFTHAGHGEMSKDDLLNEMGWPDRTWGITHIMTLSCDRTQDFMDQLETPVNAKWQEVIIPQLVEDGYPPIVVFYTVPKFATT